MLNNYKHKLRNDFTDCTTDTLKDELVDNIITDTIDLLIAIKEQQQSSSIVSIAEYLKDNIKDLITEYKKDYIEF